jgi:monothiol glutaredoxin
MSLNESVREKIENHINSNKVVLFMKGTPQQPMCGFSAKTIAALDGVWPEYSSVNVLDDEEVREGIKVYSDWPTIPQLYIDGELVGGCDIVLGMHNSGELHEVLGLDKPDRTPPELTVTDAAAEKIREAMEGHEGVALHYQVDANWESQFTLSPLQEGEITVESNGITLVVDIASAQRVNGAVIDWVKTLSGEGLSVDIPSAPPAVKQLSVQQLAKKLEAGEILLLDVRNAEDRACASIEAAVPLDQEMIDKLVEMPKDSELAFICHSGNSSLGAAEYFRKQGYTSVHNVVGGIDAWSQEIDSSIPRY